MFIFGFFIDSIGHYLILFKAPNIWLYHFYTLGEYCFLVLIFSSWQKNVVFKKVLRLSILMFAVIWIIAKIFFEKFDQPDNYTASLECVFLVGIAALTMYEVHRESMKSLFRDERFWVASAVLIYFTGNLLSFALSNLIGNWSFHHSLLNIISNLFYAGGFVCFHHRLNYGGLLSSAL
ncbi:MAG: hypothetical protein ACE5HS_17575 [bacterium]